MTHNAPSVQQKKQRPKKQKEPEKIKRQKINAPTKKRNAAHNKSKTKQNKTNKPNRYNVVDQFEPNILKKNEAKTEQDRDKTKTAENQPKAK